MILIKEQLFATRDLGVKIIELHTGSYAHAVTKKMDIELELTKIQDAVRLADNFNINCHAGHGLNYDNVSLIASIPNIKELNIGHFLLATQFLMGYKTLF